MFIWLIFFYFTTQDIIRTSEASNYTLKIILPSISLIFNSCDIQFKQKNSDNMSLFFEYYDADIFTLEYPLFQSSPNEPDAL